MIDDYDLDQNIKIYNENIWENHIIPQNNQWTNNQSDKSNDDNIFDQNKFISQNNNNVHGKSVNEIPQSIVALFSMDNELYKVNSEPLQHKGDISAYTEDDPNMIYGEYEYDKHKNIHNYWSSNEYGMFNRDSSKNNNDILQLAIQNYLSENKESIDLYIKSTIQEYVHKNLNALSQGAIYELIKEKIQINWNI